MSRGGRHDKHRMEVIAYKIHSINHYGKIIFRFSEKSDIINLNSLSVISNSMSQAEFTVIQGWYNGKITLAPIGGGTTRDIGKTEWNRVYKKKTENADEYPVE